MTFPPRKYLQRDLTLIKESLSKFNPQAIILYGSHARGEGAFCTIDGVEYAYNDYDIILLFQNLPNNDYTKIKVDLKKLTRVKWFDIGEYTPKSLGKLKNTVMGYDLFSNHLVIHGDEEILISYMVDVKQRDIRIREAEVLLFTRIWCLIGSYQSLDEIPDLAGEDLWFFHYQLSKAIFAMVDSTLIQKGAYRSQYNEKIITYLELEISELSENLLNWAYKIKINPQSGGFASLSNLDLFNQVYDRYVNSFVKLYNIMYHVNNVDDHERLLQLKKHDIKYRIISSLNKINIWKSKYKKHTFNLAQLGLLLSYNLFPQNQAFLKTCQFYLSTALDQNIEVHDWESLRKIISLERQKV
jgi:predicted nucleotidyltransferase